MSSGARRIPLPILDGTDAPGRDVRSDPPRAPIDPTTPRVALVTLGCDKNTVDSERLLGRLLGAGVALAPRTADADVVLVNTCGFIDVAKEESIDAILGAARLKAEGRVRAVVALGCLVQRYKRELGEELPEVDLFLGLTEIDRLLPELRARGLLPPLDAVPNMERPLRALASTTSHSSFLKISEGCDHTCAFCAIPLMRGRFRSTPIDALVAEARELEARGVVELNIVSQDTTWYGRDWRRDGIVDDGQYFIGRPFARMAGPAAKPPPTSGPASALRSTALPRLLTELLAATTIPWLRLFYMYPSGVTRELVALMAREPRLVPYLDLPIQHGSDAVLKRMRRPERSATIRERVAWLRDAVPDLTLRSTVIVGFPGEGEEDFEALLELLEELRFDRLGAFAYSREDGTQAAAMADQVPDAVKRERLERLQDLQRSISLERNERRVGTDVDLLVDHVAAGRRGDVAIGRTAAQAPEIDGVVRVRGAHAARPGTFLRARLTAADEDDLVAVAMGGG
ncbi:MAG: 30S ribosomal protein S12 methylthiotransferase RimO [Longimicrobiales bacterium]